VIKFLFSAAWCFHCARLIHENSDGARRQHKPPRREAWTSPVVVPAFNEAENLPRLYERLRSVLEKDRCRFELIIVDDGSSDRTLAVIQELRLQDPRVHYISLSRNFDDQAALVGPCSWA